MKLTFIGAGDAFGSGGYLNTCFLLEAKNKNLLIDCGATSLVGLKKQGFEPADLDFIFISHLHDDHFGGLPYILLDFLRGNRKKILTILGPSEIEHKTLALLELLYPGLPEKIDRNLIDFIEYESNLKTEYQDFELEIFKVLHSEQSNPHGLKLFIDDKIIAFSGDTEWTKNLIPLADEADLFICECNGFIAKTAGHLNHETILKNKDKLNAKQLILTHLSEEALENIDKFQIAVARDAMEINF